MKQSLYRIEWLFGYAPKDPEAHPLEWFSDANGFDSEDAARIAALQNGQRLRIAGPCDAVRVTSFPYAMGDWDACTLQGEALSREIPALHVALYARNDGPEQREHARACLRDCRALFAAIAHAEQREAAEEEQAQHERYEDQSGR